MYNKGNQNQDERMMEMEELLELHREIYDIRWRGKEGNVDELEKKMYDLAKEEGIDMEYMNELETQLKFPPYVDYLPDHLKTMHGGKREGAGRPSVGTTKKVSLTLPDEIWEEIEKMKEDSSQSAVLRKIVEDSMTNLQQTKQEMEHLIKRLIAYKYEQEQKFPENPDKNNGEHMYYRGYWEGISYVLNELEQFTLRHDFFPEYLYKRSEDE
ncbi:hypothetical protein B4065_1463 [Caldibacillus thermoamylovorans]|nr:hypothetical protein B4065_1463 [Caldibacillus thermoamylovorans]